MKMRSYWFQIGWESENVKDCIHDLVSGLVLDEGVEIGLVRVPDKNLYGYDLNLGAKSSLTIYFDPEHPEGISWASRYNSGIFGAGAEFDEIAWEVVRCMCGRDYISPKWRKILKDNGITVE